MLLNCLSVGIGGFFGAMGRYLFGLIPVSENFVFPIKTLCVNVLGAFLIGLIAAWGAKNSDLDPRLILLLKTGVCGGFTTFSTFSLESFDLLGGGHTGMALLYMILSAVLCLLAVFAGQALLR